MTAEATDLTAGYRRCAELTRQFGTTYYWGARILPVERRRHVFATYASCRWPTTSWTPTRLPPNHRSSRPSTD